MFKQMFKYLNTYTKFGSIYFILFYFIYFKEINTFIQQGCMELTQNNSKHIYNVAKDFYGKWMLFFLTIYSSKNLFFTLIIMRNIYAPNQHVRMISEGSCDRRNGCWKFSIASQE